MISAFNILHRPTRVAPEKNHVDGSFPFVSNELEISYDTRAKTQKTDERWFAKYWKRSSGSCEVSSRRTNLDTGNNEQSFVHLQNNITSSLVQVFICGFTLNSTCNVVDTAIYLFLSIQYHVALGKVCSRSFGFIYILTPLRTNLCY